MTKPGCFHFGFVLLCVNGKTNPVLKMFRIHHESGTISSSVNLVLESAEHAWAVTTLLLKLLSS